MPLSGRTRFCWILLVGNPAFFLVSGWVGSRRVPAPVISISMHPPAFTVPFGSSFAGCSLAHLDLRSAPAHLVLAAVDPACRAWSDSADAVGDLDRSPIGAAHPDLAVNLHLFFCRTFPLRRSSRVQLHLLANPPWCSLRLLSVSFPFRSSPCSPFLQSLFHFSPFSPRPPPSIGCFAWYWGYTPFLLFPLCC